MAHNAQNVMPLIFPAIVAAADTSAQQASDPEAERLIGKEGTKKYSLLPPVLYPPGNTTSQELIFRNPALLQVCTTSYFFSLPLPQSFSLAALFYSVNLR